MTYLDFNEPGEAASPPSYTSLHLISSSTFSIHINSPPSLSSFLMHPSLPSYFSLPYSSSSLFIFSSSSSSFLHILTSSNVYLKHTSYASLSLPLFSLPFTSHFSLYLLPLFSVYLLISSLCAFTIITTTTTTSTTTTTTTTTFNLHFYSFPFGLTSPPPSVRSR